VNPRVTPLRLVLDFGETVELDGSTLYDPTLYDPTSEAEVILVTSARRMAAAAVLQASAHLDNTTTIAVVDAAARWLNESDGEEYAYALRGAVTDGLTQLRTYGQLLGTGSAASDA
jgi:hypothetical protein